jgi:hypothetical protein
MKKIMYLLGFNYSLDAITVVDVDDDIDDANPLELFASAAVLL